MLFGQVCEVVGRKSLGEFKGERCAGCAEGNGECVIYLEFVKEIYFHENKHDRRHKYDEMLNQENNNQDGMSCILRTHMERNKNPICEHGMEAKRENKDT